MEAAAAPGLATMDEVDEIDPGEFGDNGEGDDEEGLSKALRAHILPTRQMVDDHDTSHLPY